MAKKKQKQELKQKWYEKLIKDLKKLAIVGTVKIKHSIGKRIIKEELKFGKPEYGGKRIENIAKELNIGSGELWRCIQFAKKIPEFSSVDENLSWEQIKRKLLPDENKKIEITPLPEGKYNIIYADPPWKYYDGGFKNQSQHYDSLEFEDIRDRVGKEIQKISADNCILFMWITDPMLNKIEEIVKAWGFDYSTVGFYWIKKTENDKWFFGLGNWTRANPEICIIATKGSIERKDASIPKLIISQIEEHSKKPTIVRDKIVQLVGDLPRIELFARPTGHISEKGWIFWGNGN